MTVMHATKGRYHKLSPSGVPEADNRHIADFVARRTTEIADLLHANPTILIEEAGTAFLVTRASLDETSLFLHALPGDIEFGVSEEPAYPLLSLVASLRTPGEPRYAGIVLDIADRATIERFRLMVSQPFVDLAVVDPANRFLAACRFDLTLWTRAQAHRAMDRASRHLESIPSDRRSFRRAVDELEAYLNKNQTA